MPVALRGGPHNHLGRLSRRSKAGGVAVEGKLLFRGGNTVPNLAHRGENSVLFLIWGQQSQTGGTGQFDVYREPVGQQTQPPSEKRVCPWNRFCMDVTAETIVFPQNPQGLNHQFGGVVRILEDRRRQKQPFDVVAAVKSHGQLTQLLRSESRSGYIIGLPVDAVLAVVDAKISLEYLQQRDAPPICREGVTAPRHSGASDGPSPARTVQPAGSTCRIVFGRIGQNIQLVQQLHKGASLRKDVP